MERPRPGAPRTLVTTVGMAKAREAVGLLGLTAGLLELDYVSPELNHKGRVELDFAASKTEGLDANDRERIRREAQAMGCLSGYPHTATVHDVGEDEGQPGAAEARRTARRGADAVLW